MNVRIVRRSLLRAGRVVPLAARHFRGRAILLVPGEAVAWHSTGRREELLVALAGRVRLEVKRPRATLRTITLTVGQCAFLPMGTLHRVRNATSASARYLYVTA